MPQNRGWIWFFLILTGLAILAVVTMIVYNLGQQLKPEQLAEARRLWREHGLRSYQLTYTIKTGIERSTTTYVVRVRDGNVVSASVNERPELPERFSYYGMDALLDDIARFQERDARPGSPRTFARAMFDPATGGLRWYVRSVRGEKERQEITVTSLTPLEDGP